MLDVLLESRAVTTPRPLYEATISAAAHGALIVMLVAGPSLANHDLEPQNKNEAYTRAEYIVPPDRARPQRDEHVRFVAVGARQSDQHEIGTEPASNQFASAANQSNNSIVAPRSADQADDAYSVLNVDSAAVRDPSSAAPAYPPAMMSLAIEGAATISFVVDTSGGVDLRTVKTLTATNPAFEHAVLEALPRMRFHPARIGRTPVRQTESEEFKFELKRLAIGRP
jgi:TonB family protein